MSKYKPIVAKSIKCKDCEERYTNMDDVNFIHEFQCCVHCLYEQKYASKQKDANLMRAQAFQRMLSRYGYTLKTWVV